MNKQYRVQSADFLGVVNRGWGYGRTGSWGRWSTVFRSPDEKLAEEYFDKHSKKGLRRWRLVFGSEVKKKSL